MKALFLSTLFLGISCCLHAQIQITSSDMPSSGDNYIMTNAFNDGSVDPEQTGANFTWDYSALTPVGSSTDTFGNIFYLPLTYQLFFLGSNLVEFNGQSINLGVATIEDVYTVYDAGSSSYEMSGYAGSLSGVPVPMVYSNKDVIYNFPLQYGNVDSNDASLVADVPTVIYIEQQRHRVNEVDGWGTLITPIASYNVLRIKSTISDIDSIYLATSGFGITFPVKTYEYKWLTQGEGIPVMQVNAQDAFGLPVVSSITYRDTSVFIGIESLIDSDPVAVFPNPADQELTVRWQAGNVGAVSVYNSIGQRAIFNPQFISGEHLALNSLSKGIYILRLETKSGSSACRFTVNR